ncbi:MAG: PRC-barrel domain-containing protein [Xanthobacteraceae bacterium]
MKRSTLAGSVAACICLGLSVPSLAAEPPVADTATQPAPSVKNFSAPKPAEKCLSDLRAFDSQMDKDGYWLGGSGDGFGYPMEGYGVYGPPLIDSRTEATGIGYRNARPGYELRTLFAAANILARQGQQQPCEDVLATTRDIYKVYVADMHSGKMPMADVQGWRQLQIAAAQPVTSTNATLRSDELVGTEVRSPQNGALGSVEDLVMNPQTGKVAYLVIAEGGVFGIDEKYVPVPLDAFKISPNVKLLVLGTTKSVLGAAPRVSKDQFANPGHFDKQSQKVDAYWKTHLSDKGKD